jgi:hypothetical protein
MPSYSDIQRLVETAADVARRAGVPTGLVGFEGKGVVGWTLERGKVSYVNSKPGDSDYKSWTTIDGTKVLLPNGELWSVTYSWGVTDERGSFDQTYGGPMSKEALVGSTGAPFSAICRTLERFLALHS